MAEARKCIFITGAGSGIGRASALLFAERGWFVGISDIDARGLKETAVDLPADRHCAVEHDVRDEAQWTDALDVFSKASGGRCDALMNNAGVGRGGNIDEMPIEDIDLVLDVNLRGVILGARAGLPLLKRTPNSILLNTASVAGFVGAPRMSIYVATKYAVRGLSESLAVEFAPNKVRVATLAPWFVDTAILDNGAGPGSNEKLRDRLVAQDVPIYPVSRAAERAWDAVHGKQMHYFVGEAAERAQLLSRFLPGLVRKQMLKNVLSD